MSLLVLVSTFVLLLLLTLAWKKSLLISAGAALGVACLFQTAVYGFNPASLLSAGIHGSLTALEIALLIVGALSFFNYLRAANFLPKLEETVRQFSTNQLIVVLLLCFFFGSFVEGISGFGTPAMIIAPLLVALRFPTYLAVILPLLANTIPVLFGAVGTPVKIGFADLPVNLVPLYASLLMLLPVLALPFFLKNFLTPENLLQTAANKATVNWIALGAGASFALPFIFLSTTGPEFPSLLAGIIGLIIWLGLLKVLRPPQTFITIKTGLAFFHTFKPYLFVALLLLAGKLGLTAKWLISWPAIGLQKNISAFQPGLIFLAGLFLMHFIAPQKHRVALRPVFQQTLRNMPAVLGTIACLAILARLLSQHLSITEIFAADTGMPLFFFSAASVITGLLGSFMAGSATVSNLLFGGQWNQVAQHLDLPAQLLLACQLAGAAIGNALSIQNIVMVQAVLNEQALERMVLRKLWKVILLFVLLICLTAFVIGWWLPAG